MLKRISHDDYFIDHNFERLIWTKQDKNLYSKSSCNFIVKVLCELNFELFFYRRYDTNFLQLWGFVSDKEGNFIQLLGLNRLELESLRDNFDKIGRVFISQRRQKSLIGSGPTNVNFVFCKVTNVRVWLRISFMLWKGVGSLREKSAVKHEDVCPVIIWDFLEYLNNFYFYFRLNSALKWGFNWFIEYTVYFRGKIKLAF